MGVHPPQTGGIGYDPWPYIVKYPLSQMVVFAPMVALTRLVLLDCLVQEHLILRSQGEMATLDSVMPVLQRSFPNCLD